MAMITIGAYTCPDPIEYGFELNDLDSENTGRSEDGYMTRERIRHGVVKISLKWTMLTTTEANAILDAVTPVSFSVTWQYANTTRTSTMYCAGQSVNCKGIPSTNDYRWEISLNLIEM